MSAARSLRGGLRAAAVVAALGLAGAAGDAYANQWPDRLEGHGGPVRGVAVSADGRHALSASFDYTVIHWSLENGEGEIHQRLVGHDAPVNAVAFVPGDSLAVSASDDGTVGLWDLAAGELVARFEGGGDKMLGLDVADDGRLAASGSWDGTARIWDLEQRAPGAVLRGDDGNVHAVAFSSDGGRLFTGAEDGTIRMWDVAGGTMLRRVLNHGWSVTALEVVPGDEYLIFGASDGSAGVVEIDTGEVVRELGQHRGPVLAIAIDAGEEIAALTGADGHIRLYRMADWTMQHDHANPYGPIWAAAFTPDGAMVYHGGLDDYVIGLQIDPRQALEPALGDFPRRFKPIEEMEPGEREFARKCSVCHTLTPDDANRAGPTLYRLFGREAGSLPDYPYSNALLDSDIIWTEETVAQLFDEGPDVVTPGTKMPIQRLRDTDDLEALVAYLKRATEPEAGEEPE